MDERPLVDDYVQEFKESAPELIKKNIELAKAEIGPMRNHALLGAGGFGGAGFFLIKAVSMFGFAFTFAMAMLIHHVGERSVLTSIFWGFIISGSLFLLVAIVAALFGKGRLKKVHVPTQTIEEAKATLQTLSDSIGKGRENAKTIVEANEYARAEARKARDKSGQKNPLTRLFNRQSDGVDEKAS